MSRNKYNARKFNPHQKKYHKVGQVCNNALVTVYLRNFITEWREASLADCGNRCVITDTKDNLNVHHLSKRYKDLVKEAHENLGITNKVLTAKYPLTELPLLKEELLRLHFKYGLGVAINGDLHTIYHEEYRNNITAESFREFYKKIKELDWRQYVEEFYEKNKKYFY